MFEYIFQSIIVTMCIEGGFMTGMALLGVILGKTRFDVTPDHHLKMIGLLFILVLAVRGLILVWTTQT